MLAPDLIDKTKAAIAAITDPQVSIDTVDITTCDREAIHTPQSIQPHGVMIVLSGWIITRVSQNVQSYLDCAP